MWEQEKKVNFIPNVCNYVPAMFAYKPFCSLSCGYRKCGMFIATLVNNSEVTVSTIDWRVYIIFYTSTVV